MQHGENNQTLNYMKKFKLLAIALLMTITANATVNLTPGTNYSNDNPIELEGVELEPVLKPELVAEANKRHDIIELMNPKPETESWIKLAQRDGIKEHKFLEDMTWVGIPIFVAGIIAKSEKHAFRQDYKNKHANTRLLTDFKTGIDDYLQFFGPAFTLGLKLGGVEGRSDWPRLFASAGLGYASMAIIVNSIKYSASEMRPDGSTANSWPSGHTATAFVGATILHKEYGLTRSPWYSIAGYGLATATGVMRVLNNRHWVSDVLSGAGIGILTGELGYAIADVLFKKKGLLRNNLPDNFGEAKHPSFFSIGMGLGLGSNDLDFGLSDEGIDMNLKFGISTVVTAEGAYFFNKYVGIGGRLSVKSSPIKGWNNFLDMAKFSIGTYSDYLGIEESQALSSAFTVNNLNIESDHMTEFIASVGVYGNIPLSKRFSIGVKGLIGRSFMQDLNISSTTAGNVVNMDYEFKYNSQNQNTHLYLNTNTITDKIIEMGYNPDIDDYYPINKGLDESDMNTTDNYIYLKGFEKTEKTYAAEWDYLNVHGESSTSWGTGVSLAYAYKQKFTWKVFCDIDFTRKNYTLSYKPLGMLEQAVPKFAEIYPLLYDDMEYSVKIKKHMTSWVLGASFAIAF